MGSTRDRIRTAERGPAAAAACVREDARLHALSASPDSAPPQPRRHCASAVALSQPVSRDMVRAQRRRPASCHRRMASRSLLTATLVVACLAVARGGDPNYAFDDYTNLLPLPNHHTNGTTLLVLPARLTWSWGGSGGQPKVLAAATRRYDGIIFAWGSPTVQPPSGTAVLRRVNIKVDDPDDSFAALQLGMDESYALDVPTTGTATIHAPAVWGALRALETLAQMIEYHPGGTPMGAQGNKAAMPWGSQMDARHQKEYTLAWAPWHIADAPRFQHRGIMLDTARHFFTVPGILRQFDAMAAAKMNTMHWHITDGNSVPIESKLFPELHRKGAYNPVTMVYTQEQVKGVVDYARFRGIRVVPEFDMPAHANAWALGAPAGAMLLCPKATGFGNTTGFDTQGNPDAYFDATSEAAYTFLDSFIGEMAGLFPDKVLHLGGDEVGSACYNQSASVREWLQRHPGAGVDDIIPMFWTRVHKIAAKHGKSVMNWEEVFEAIYLKGGPTVCKAGVDSCKGGPGCTGFVSVALYECIFCVLIGRPLCVCTQTWTMVRFSMRAEWHEERDRTRGGEVVRCGGAPSSDRQR
jgi:hypothetical protein